MAADGVATDAGGADDAAAEADGAEGAAVEADGVEDAEADAGGIVAATCRAATVRPGSVAVGPLGGAAGCGVVVPVVVAVSVALEGSADFPLCDATAVVSAGARGLAPAAGVFDVVSDADLPRAGSAAGGASLTVTEAGC